MADNEMKWCPLSQNECRDDCAWADVAYDMDDDGITKYVTCAMLLIAGGILGLEIRVED